MKDYLTFFSKWLDRQFVHQDEEAHKQYILEVVSEKYMTNEDDATYWGKHSFNSMYHLASKDLQNRLWNLVK